MGKSGLRVTGYGTILIPLSIFLFLFLTLTSCQFRPKEYNIALAIDFPPFAYLEDDTLKGIEVDLIYLLKDKLNANIIISTFVFSQILETFYEGEYDFALGGITETESRKEIFDFSLPYYHAGQAIVTLENNNANIEKLEDISTSRIGVQNYSTSLLFLENSLVKEKKITANNIRKYNDLDALLKALTSNEVRYILLEHSIAQLVSANDLFKIAFVNPESENYGIVFKKDSTLLEPVNKALINILKSEEWAKVMKQLTIDN